jgi:hypothetical protein
MVYEALFGVLGLLVGGLLGHRLAIRRDKRQEFNAVAIPVIQSLLEMEEQLGAGFLNKRLDLGSLDHVKPYLRERQRLKLQVLVADYQRSLAKAFPENEAKPWQGPDPVQEQFPTLERAVGKLRKFLRVR